MVQAARRRSPAGALPMISSLTPPMAPLSPPYALARRRDQSGVRYIWRSSR
jgi:hypothetical protein